MCMINYLKSITESGLVFISYIGYIILQFEKIIVV